MHTPPARHRRRAVAELRGDIDLDRHARELLEPVFRDHAGVEWRCRRRSIVTRATSSESNGSSGRCTLRVAGLS